MADNPHLGHRQRLKARAAAHGFASLASHEQVELLLCYAIPQGNVNPLAHTLINRFGSLAGICTASRQELLEIDGIGEHTATLLALVPGLVKAFLEAEAPTVKRFTSLGQLEDLLIRHYVGETAETVCLLLFDGRMELLCMEELYRGSVSAVTASVRSIAERVIRYNAAGVVLAHNHPGGLAVPSGEDLCSTRQLITSLNLLGISLIEHILVAGNRAIPLLMHDNCHGRLTEFANFDAKRFYANSDAEEQG